MSAEISSNQQHSPSQQCLGSTLCVTVAFAAQETSYCNNKMWIYMVGNAYKFTIYQEKNEEKTYLTDIHSRIADLLYVIPSAATTGSIII